MSNDDAKEKYELCLKITTDAINKLKIVNNKKISERMLGFVMDYYNDSKYYASKKQYATALEAIAYAHGIIDGGVLCGLFEIPGYHLRKVDE